MLLLEYLLYVLLHWRTYIVIFEYTMSVFLTGSEKYTTQKIKAYKEMC